MNILLRYYKRLRISTQLALWFLLIALGPFACAGYFAYKHSADSLYKQVTNNLVAISERQVDEIERWILERERDVTTLARSPAVIRGLIERGRNDDALEEQFLAYTEGGDYEDAFLIETDGETVFALNRNDLRGINSAFNNRFRSVSKNKNSVAIASLDYRYCITCRSSPI